MAEAPFSWPIRSCPATFRTSGEPQLDGARRKAWAESGFALAVRTATPQAWAELVASGLPLVQDAGFTEIAPGGSTMVADHPALRRP